MGTNFIPVPGRESLEYRLKQLENGRFSDSYTYTSLLRGCGNAKSLSHGKRVHVHILQAVHSDRRFLENLLIEMYGKCGSLQDARDVFDSMRERNVFSWTLMITACAQNGHLREALQVFRLSHLEGSRPDVFVFSIALAACSSLRALTEGSRMHESIRGTDMEEHIVVANNLVNMYGKCGRVECARKIFERMEGKDIVCWNTMITAYAQQRYGSEAILLFRRINQEGLKPDSVTFVGVVGGIGTTCLAGEFECILQQIKGCGYGNNAVVQTALVSMYSRLGRLKEARHAFDEVQNKKAVTWNAMVTAYAQLGQNKDAFQLFRQMDLEGTKPDEVTFLSLLTCSLVLTELEKLHERIVLEGFELNVMIGTTLVSTYGKCGSVVDAREVFDRVQKMDNLHPWNAMIAAYAQQDHNKEALEIYQKMVRQGMKPDQVTLVAILGACSNLAALEQGTRIYATNCSIVLEADVYLRTALVNLYGKCGHIEEAKAIFDKMSRRDTIAWNAMLASYAQQGRLSEAMDHYIQMHLAGAHANAVTFCIIFFGISHGGLVSDAVHYFLSMSADYSVVPTSDHFGCMVDVFGRSGWLCEAEELLRIMPFIPDCETYTSLLAACKLHGDIDRAVRIADNVLQLESEKRVPYVLLSSIYSAAGKLDTVASLQKVEGKWLQQEEGCSYIEVDGEVHEFVTGDTNHVCVDEIHARLNQLLHINDEFAYHSEMLALAFGLIFLDPEKQLLIVKNKRVCSCCHSQLKLISRVVNRCIGVRDSRESHHFKDGTCSCKDYW